jgi:ferredoxin
LIWIKERSDRTGYLPAMSKRKIISIDQAKCNGCGLCIPNCPEGALRVIDGKARLVSDLFCDGLGACLGYCPEGAIAVEEREAEPYDETKVMANIAAQGANTIRAHLDHLKSHGEDALLAEAVNYLAKNGIAVPEAEYGGHSHEHGGCPGTRAMDMPHTDGNAKASELSNWPVQLHLMSPTAPQLAGQDVVLSADCVAYAMGDFHKKWLAGKSLAIACPKLDESAEIYREKITALIDHAKINTLTVLMMEVPCCRGLLAIAEEALGHAHRKIPLKAVTVGIRGGEILSERWV